MSRSLGIYLYPLQEKVSAPQISGTTPFADTTTVTIATSSSNAKIYYTDDGSEPDQHATLYSGPDHAERLEDHQGHCLPWQHCLGCLFEELREAVG